MRAAFCLALAACAAVASADITLVEETRTLSLSAQGQSDFGSNGDLLFELGSSGNDDPFAPWKVAPCSPTALSPRSTRPPASF